MKPLVGTLALLVFLSVFNVCIATEALFDAGHGQYELMTSHSRFDDARGYLTGAGHTISELNSPVTLAALSGFDIYVTGTLDVGYTYSEVVAMQDYVAAGGVVLDIHDGGYYSDDATPSVNSFLAAYGMELSGVSNFGSGLIVTGFANHCVTNGVQTIGLDFVRLLVNITSPAVDLTTGATDILAVYENRNGGKVIAMSDDNLWSDSDSGSDHNIDEFDNLALLLNIFDCFGGTVAIETVSWGSVKTLYR